MKHHGSNYAGSDDGRLHAFVMDSCFPSQATQQESTVLVIKETKTKPRRSARSWFQIKASVNTSSRQRWTSRAGAGAVAPCSKAMVNRQSSLFRKRAVKNSRQSDTILENAEGRQSVKWSSRERSERSRRNYMEMEDVCRKSKAVLDNKRVLFPWLVTHAGAITARCKMVHDGKTAYHRIKNKYQAKRCCRLERRSCG